MTLRREYSIITCSNNLQLHKRSRGAKPTADHMYFESISPRVLPGCCVVQMLNVCARMIFLYNQVSTYTLFFMDVQLLVGKNESTFLWGSEVKLIGTEN